MSAGTSLSSPLAAGAWARLKSHFGAKVGFASPSLYAKYPAVGSVPGVPGGVTQKVDGFNDILTGVNGLYSSTPYYDFTTGMGTIDIAAKRASIPH
jgi:subtilase family serine protease